ncbi:MAG TPA: aldo/keto reductase [Bacteroidales bacterium]|nr:aldo/keto reductase [Bacteroidales bacterium]
MIPMNSPLPVNPALVPKVACQNGANIPVVGLGTFGSDNYSPDQVAAAVDQAVRLGYRHIDCAAVYGNEKEIGCVLKRLFDEGVVKREDLWITSKVWNNKHGAVREACLESLANLGLSYLDLYLVHWPFPNHHEKGVAVDSRDPHAVPYDHARYLKTWSAMEALVDDGLVRHIGTSNMTRAKMQLLLKDCRIRPIVNEMEMHPHFQQPELFAYLAGEGIKAIGFCPIGSPGRPERDKTPEDTVPIEDPVIVAIAQAHGVHPAVICVKWAAQNGQIPIPFSVKPEKFMANLRCVTEDPLTLTEMAAIKQLDKGNRFIKGQVFLWPEAKDWHDLWDEDGRIAGYER